ncbi:hypothetical protein PRUPE_6G008700 [Prunus persica]|uniref:Uncharacterized protein n=1 Tax=Prunus persica TaxID=3760 RepID=A0A251NID0_PRUPE|nr:hypothetical protein PRUPE_6G008700 [Prunus persica]
MEKQHRCRRLVLVPCPFQGHMTPMLQLGTILHSRGFYITIAHTQFNFPNPLNFPDFNFLEIYEDVISGFNANCKAPLRESLARMMEKEDQHSKIACIIYDEYISAANMLTYQEIPRLLKDDLWYSTYVGAEAMMLELVPGLEPLRFKDLPITNFRDLDDLPQLIVNAHDSRSYSAIIWNTMDCLEQSSLAHLRQEYQLPLFPIGPLHRTIPAPSISLLKEDQNCISWLDKQSHNSVIYVSVGSIAFLDSKELAEMAWGLANSEHPFLWVVRTDSISLPESFQETVGERGCITKWAPQKQVLAHSAVGGFWSHCGWNSTIESISEGVPMICQPYFGDQRVNSRYLSLVWGVGLEWENDMNRGPIKEAIRMLMVGKEGEVIRQSAKDLKVKIELSMKQAVSSYNSLNELVDQILSF